MDAKTVNRLSLAVGALGLVALAGAGLLVLRMETQTPAAPPAGPTAAAGDHAGEAEKHGAEEAHGKEEAAGAHAEGDGHGHGTEESDLDRPVEELFAAKCEHDVLQHQCDECRYEVGVVKLPAALLGEKGKEALVKTASSSTQSFSEELALTGEVQLSEAKTVHVSSPLPGTLRGVSVGLGDRVAAGAPLLQIDSHEVSEAKAALRKGLASLDLARKTADREARLFEKKISAQAEVEEARARLAEAEVEVASSRLRLARMGVPEHAVAELQEGRGDLSGLFTVRAPRGGVVLEKHAVVGEHVEPEEDLVLLSDLSEVWVWANLKEADLHFLGRAGGRAQAEVEAPGGGRRYRGRVDIVSGTMDEATRTVRARVVLANPGGALRPGMFVRIRLLLPGAPGAVAVPKAAVMADAGRSFVFVHKQGDYWVRRPVTVGKEVGGFVEVREGLSKGQTVLADGAFLAKSDVLRSKMGAGCAD